MKNKKETETKQDDLFIVDCLDGEFVELSVDITELTKIGLDTKYIELVFNDLEAWGHA
jgi:hypothetical protein